MIVCPKCKAENDPANVTCHRCGFSLIDDPSMNSDPHIGRVIGGRYKLSRNLGSGEVGMVYEALHEANNRRVAVKIIHPDVAHTHGDELLRWAQRTAQIRHAKVAAIVGAKRESDGLTYVVTEFLEGQTLMEKLRSAGPMDPMTTADILFQLCSALAPIHRAGRPHANLKPENVFLLTDDRHEVFVKIVDIGSPTLFGVQTLGDRKVIVGTAKYFSPEQASGAAVGLPSDQFTVGIIGYLLLTGALPFYGATPPQLLESISRGRFRPLRERAPQTPDALADIIHRCLEVDPYSRFKDLRALAKAFAAVIKAQRQRDDHSQDSDSLDGSSLDGNDAGAENSDPDNTMLISVPSELRQFLGSNRQDDSESEHTEELMPIPQPLSFTGELDGDDIQAAIEDALDVFSGAELAGARSTPIESNSEGQTADISLQDVDALLGGQKESQTGAKDGSVGDVEENDDPLGHLFDEALEELDVNPGSKGLMDGGSPAATNRNRGALDSSDDDGELFIEPAIQQSPSTPLLSPLEGTGDTPTYPFGSGAPGTSADPADPPRGPSVHSQTGSLLPADIISALDMDVQSPVGQQAKQAETVSSPLATAADFAAINPTSQSDASALVRRTIQRAAIVTRPGVAIFLLVLLALVGTTYRMIELENEREAELESLRAIAVRQRQSRLAADKAKPGQRRLSLQTVPSGATVTEDDDVLGNTPVTIVFDAPETRTFQLTLAGHRRVKYKVDPRSLTFEGDKVVRILNLTPVSDSDQAEEEMVFGSTGDSKAQVKERSKSQPDARKVNEPAATKKGPGSGSRVKPRRKVPRKSQARPGSSRDGNRVVPRLPQRRRPIERSRSSGRSNAKPKPKATPKKADELVNPFD